MAGDINEYLFKTVVIGAPKVGKTALINFLVNKVFTQNYRSTIGVDFQLKVSPEMGDDLARVQLWDIGGNELNGTPNMMRAYLKETQIVWVCFDPRDRKTFEHTDWQAVINKVVLLEGQPKPDIYLVATCSDKESKPQVTKAEMEALGQSLNQSGTFCGIYHVSAKSKEGVEKLFTDSCKNRIERVNPTNINLETLKINLETLKNYLIRQTERPELSQSKKERFERLLTEIEDTRNPKTDQLIEKTKEIAGEYTPTYNPIVMLYNLFTAPTSLQQFDAVFAPNPSARGPQPLL